LTATPSTQRMWSVKSVRRAFRSSAARYVGILAVLTLVVAVVPSASKGSVSSQASAKRASFKDVVVSPSGRIGPINGRYLVMGRSTEANVKKAEKRKPDWRGKDMGRGGPVAWHLTYRLRIAGSKTTCTREYDFPFSTHRLSDFESACRYLKTARGIRVGMSAAKAEGLAGQKAEYSPGFGRACMIEGYAITEQRGSNWLAVWMKQYGDFSTVHYGPAIFIHLYGAHSIWWDTCA
jgi:hypothetical protein